MPTTKAAEAADPPVIKVGLLRESKIPQDTRTALTPEQCKEALANYQHLRLVVQSATASDCKNNEPTPNQESMRCFTDAEYVAAGINVVDSLDDCDILVGVKEVQPDILIPDKTYIFFSHTIKAQAHNRTLLCEILSRNIRLVDLELLTNNDGLRVVAFGRWAGIVGTHNGLYAWAKRQGLDLLPRLHSLHGGYTEAKLRHYPSFGERVGRMRVVLTGDGRVSSGCVEVLEACGVRRLTPEEFLTDNELDNESGPVYCQLSADKLYKKLMPDAGPINGVASGRWHWDERFFKDPTDYHSQVMPYLWRADVLINGIYWDNRTDPLFNLEDMRDPRFRVGVISDITCDLAPMSSIPATVRASTIEAPIFEFDPATGKEVVQGSSDQPNAPSSSSQTVWMTTIDNLPNEVPRESSHEFGEGLLRHVLPELIGNGGMIRRATIADYGRLQPKFTYLQEFVDGR